MITLRKSVSYAGLSAVFGGKMWQVYMPNGETTWHSTKKSATKTIRQAWGHDKEMKRVLMAQLNKCKGRAYCILN